MALIEPPGQAVPAVMALLAEVVAAALRAVEAMEPPSENRHHAAPVAANARVDRVLLDADVVRVIGGRGLPRLGNGPQVVAALHFLRSEFILAAELFLHVLLELDADKRERAGMVDAAEAAAVGGTACGARLAHEVAAVHRHGLVEELLAHLAGYGFSGGGRRRGSNLRGVDVLVGLFGGHFPSAGLVLARVDMMQKVVQLRGDPRKVDVGFLADRAVRDGLRVHGSVHAPEAEHVAACLYHGLVG